RGFCSRLRTSVLLFQRLTALFSRKRAGTGDAVTRSMNPQELRERIVAWVVDIGHAVGPLYRRRATASRADPLKRAADSAAANHRSAQRAGSRRVFPAKLPLAREETDAAVGALEVLYRDGTSRDAEAGRLLDEGRQLTRILARSRETAQAREGTSRNPNRR